MNNRVTRRIGGGFADRVVGSPRRIGTRRAGRRRRAMGLRCHGRGVEAIEQLESRIVLAGTVPSIEGTVFYDLNSDDQPSAEEVLVNVNVQLRLDDGDGNYDESTDVLVGTTTTDETGLYCFGDLDSSATYYVVRPAQAVGEFSLFRIISPSIQPDAEVPTRFDILDSDDQVDLAIDKDNGVSTVVPGESIDYTIVVTNNGPADAARISVFDQFPEKLTDVEFTSTSSGDVTGNTEMGVDEIDDLVSMAAGSSITYTVTAKVLSDATGTLVNTATVTSPDNDPDESNNSSMDIDLLTPMADLSITKDNGVTTVVPGESVAYSIVVRNNGPSDASRISVFDRFPVELTDVQFTSTAQGGATGNAESGVDEIDDFVTMPAGSSITYTVTANVRSSAAGRLENTATVSSAVSDPDESNNMATDSDPLNPMADLSISKDNVASTVVPGAATTYTIVATNNGPSDVSGVSVIDQFSGELTNVRFTSTTQGNATGNTESGVDEIDDLLEMPAGSSVTYVVSATVRPDATGTIANTATVSADDVDPDQSNNSSTVVDELTPVADLEVIKDNGQDRVRPGERIKYTILVRSDGPSDAPGTRVVDLFSSDLLNVSYTRQDDQGTTEGTGDIDEIITVPASGSVVYRVEATVSRSLGNTLSNTASVSTSAGITDPDLSNNSSTDVDEVRRPAKVLGSEPAILVSTFVDPASSERYQVTAHSSGKMIVNAWFDHDTSDLILAIDDSQGNTIAVSDSDDDNEQLTIPVVSQESYFIRVINPDGDEVGSPLDLEIENFAAPAPQILRLTSDSDTGWSDSDAITADTTPTVVLQADLNSFISMDIPVLEPEDPENNNATLPPGAGVAVHVVLTNLDSGLSESGYAVSLSENSALYAFTPTEGGSLSSGAYVVSSAVHVFDGTSSGVVAEPALGRGPLSDPFWLTVDDVAPQAADRPDLISTSDTGRSSVDNVTSKMQPAFAGVGEPNSIVRIVANRFDVDEVVGQAVISANGQWEVTVEPLSNDSYGFRAEYEDAAGNVSSIGEVLSAEIDGVPPNTPFLKLISSADSESSDADNAASQDTPTFSMTTTDPQQEQHLISFNYAYRIYLRTDAAVETLIYDSSLDADIPAENRLDGLTDLEQLTRALGPLADGVHNLKLEVEDRAGNISADFLLNVTVDTQPPPADIDLLDSSDSGAVGDDDVTKIDQPAFGGISEVNSQVTIFANGVRVGSGVVGSDTSDGTPNDGFGVWEVTVEPLADGQYEVETLVEDAAGNFARSDVLTVWIDTALPNLPLLELISDTGHSPVDGITGDSTPSVSVTANDTPDGGDNPFPHDLQYRIYDRTGAIPEQLLVDSLAELGGLSSEGLFNVTLPDLIDGVHNLKLEVEDRAGNISHEFLLEILIDTEEPAIEIELAEFSDSGMNAADRVTNIREPAFLGVGTVGDEVLVFANGQLVGETIVKGDETDGMPNDGRGLWEVTVEPLDDGVYQVIARIEDWSGHVVFSDAVTVEVDTLAPNTPLLDLLENMDTGRHNDDNVTRAEDLVFSATTSDPNEADHLVLIPGGQNFKYRVFARPESGTEVLVYDSVTDNRLTDRLDGLTASRRVLTLPLDLPEGLHNLKLEVEDRAGNISHDYLLDLLVDRTAFAGDGFLHPDSDTGVISIVETFEDGVTSDRVPTFAGRAEANSLVTVSIDGVPAGATVAVPLDGDDAVQPPDEPYAIQGNWRLESTIALDDGEHLVTFEYEDPAGNRLRSTLVMVTDTQGPRVLNVTRDEAGFPSVFDPKPSSGPDPLIDRLVIHFGDDLALSGDDVIAIPLAEEEGNYTIVGDANGNIPIVRVDVETEDSDVGPVARAILVLAEPLPDDRFTLTVSETISDRAGNLLDGESGAQAPFEGAPGTSALDPIFASGDGVPGGDFVARFTVDSRPEIGAWASGSVWVDTNGNFKFDPDNLDATNRDIVYRAGFTSDDVFAGNFSLFPEDVTDGFDKLAVYGRFDGTFRFLVDTDNDGVPNIDRTDPNDANGIPVAGRFDNSQANGDEVGVFDGQFWYFDTDHDFRTDLIMPSHLTGYPIVGDFDGDGFDDLATWTDNRFMIDLAAGSLRGWDGFADQTIHFGFSGVRERPVAADMDQDGFEDLGLWVPDREGVTNRTQSEWYFLLSGGRTLLDRVSPQDDPINSDPTIDFTPTPFGPDLFARFGDEFALPVVGNFDPPTVSLIVEAEEDSNARGALDVNDDGQVSPLDALLVFNQLNASGLSELTDPLASAPHLDVNSDGFITPVDALLILNELNGGGDLAARPATSANGANDNLVASALAADRYFESLEDDNGHGLRPNLAT